MLNLDTCKFCVWGFKNSYNTFRHILEAFYRALKFMGREVMWLDEGSDLSGIDFSNTFFISMEYAVRGMPKRKDCFYAIHNIESRAKEYLSGFPLLNYGLYVNSMNVDGWEELASDTFFHIQSWETYSSVVFRWATDLLPPEIEANKPNAVFRFGSREANFVGTAIEELTPFARACSENGLDFRVHSQVSIEENVRLIQRSYIAPAINIPWQTEVGYVPCRIFKNISYGQMGVTNNLAAYNLFKGRVVYNSDPYQLFYDARDQLVSISLKSLHELMDEVGKNHTYLNKISALLEAAKRMNNGLKYTPITIPDTRLKT